VVRQSLEEAELKSLWLRLAPSATVLGLLLSAVLALSRPQQRESDLHRA